MATINKVAERKMNGVRSGAVLSGFDGNGKERGGSCVLVLVSAKSSNEKSIPVYSHNI